MAESLRQSDVEVIQYNKKTSDYIKCKSTKKAFTELFGAKLKWRTLKIGSWELAADSHLSDNINTELVLLGRNILFPRSFIKNWQLKKKDEPEKKR